MRIGALLWMACAQFFLFEQIVRSAWTLPYRFSTDYVSDLGASVCSATICSPWHWLMNASFVLQGLLIAGGAVLAWNRVRPLGRIGLGLLQVCGVGVIVVGFVPENGDAGLHRLGAGLHFFGGGLGMIALGVYFGRWFGAFSAAVGVVVLASVVELAQGGGIVGQEIGIGWLERIAAYGIAGWMTVLGVWNYLRARDRFNSVVSTILCKPILTSSLFSKP